MPQNEGQVISVAGLNDHDVSRTDSGNLRNTDLVEVGAKLSKQETPFLESEVSTGGVGGASPLVQANRASGHVLKADVGSVRRNVARRCLAPDISSNVPEASDAPALGNRTEFGVLEVARKEIERLGRHGNRRPSVVLSR